MFFKIFFIKKIFSLYNKNMLFYKKNASFFKEQKSYLFTINGKKTYINLFKINNLSDFYLNFTKNPYLLDNEGFIIHEFPVLWTITFKFSCDLIFVDKNGLINAIYNDFEKNKFTKVHPNTKFLYVLPSKTIEAFKIKKNLSVGHIRSRKKQKKLFKSID